MEQKEMNNEIAKIFGLKVNEVVWFECRLNLANKEVLITMLLKGDSTKAKKVKLLMQKV